MSRLDDNIFKIKRRVKDLCADLARFTTTHTRRIIYQIKSPKEKKKTNNNIYLVYTMGKVASMSVLESIGKRLPHLNSYAMHFLTQKNLELQEKLLSGSGFVGNVMYKDIHTKHAKNILQCIDNNPNKRIKIVTIIREPLSQAISQIFQQLNLHDVNTFKHLALNTPNIDYQYAEHWCNEELRSISGIDILEQPFDKEQGYNIYSNDKYDVLVIKFDDINRVFNDAMEAISTVPNWTLSRVNISSNKNYSKEYSDFKSQLTVDQQLIDSLYQSQYMSHFYTDEEISKLKQKWRIA